MSLRASSYNIYVPIQGVEDKVLLVHGLTGAVDLVARDTAAYLRTHAVRAPRPLHGQWSEDAEPAPADTRPADETIAALVARGYLTARDQDDEQALVAKGATVMHRRALAASFDYVIMPTYGCNLRCGYCFQDHMRTDERYRHLLTRMDLAMVDRIFDAMPVLEGQVSSGATSSAQRTITLFGGEPLLADNLAVIRHIVATARARGITSISAVTNATELAAYEELLGADGISMLQITLDGPPAIHDTRRVQADGSGTFSQIADNIDLALARGVHVRARINVDRANLAELPELARVLIARGWTANPRFTPYTAAITSLNAQTPISSTFDSGQLTIALDQLRKISPEVSALHRPSDGLRQRFLKVFEGEVAAYSLFSASFCGAHTGMYVFDAFGDIYKCWDKTGDEKLRVGSVRADGEVVLRTSPTREGTDPVPTRQRRKFLPMVGAIPNDVATWQHRTIPANPTCSRCRFAFFCGGGCATNAAERNGSFYANYCDGFQANFRRAVDEAYRAFASGERSTTRRSSICGA